MRHPSGDRNLQCVPLLSASWLWSAGRYVPRRTIIMHSLEYSRQCCQCAIRIRTTLLCSRWHHICSLLAEFGYMGQIFFKRPFRGGMPFLPSLILLLIQLPKLLFKRWEQPSLGSNEKTRTTVKPHQHLYPNIFNNNTLQYIFIETFKALKKHFLTFFIPSLTFKHSTLI